MPGSRVPERIIKDVCVDHGLPRSRLSLYAHDIPAL